jgi:hypothetical protein
MTVIRYIEGNQLRLSVAATAEANSERPQFDHVIQWLVTQDTD